jgi:transposase
LTDSEIVLGLPLYEISNIERRGGTITISARYAGPISCPKCGGSRLRNKGWCRRSVRHDDWGFRRSVLALEVRKSRCLDCGCSFRQQLPGIQPCQRASESFQEMIYQQHLDGINRSCLGRRKGIGAATVQRYFLTHLRRRARQDHLFVCPQILGIDEHFFTRKKGYATTFCDLKNHRIYDITLDRSEAATLIFFACKAKTRSAWSAWTWRPSTVLSSKCSFRKL